MPLHHVAQFLALDLLGDGLHTAMARQTASFTIEARDASGNRQAAGGDRFICSVRGSSSCRRQGSLVLR